MHLQRLLIALLASLLMFQDTLGADKIQDECIPKAPIFTRFLLKSPPSITPEALDEKIDSLAMGMNWTGTIKRTGALWRFGFDYKKGKTFLKLQLIKNLPSNLTESEISQFTKAREGDFDTWTYTYGTSPQTQETKPHVSQNPLSLEEAMGMVGAPLVVREEARYPRLITMRGLAAKIKDQKVVFYTGAGISAGVVPTMPEIMTALGLTEELKEEKAVSALIRNVLANPEFYIEVMDKFYQPCYYGKPTAAHTALRDLIIFKNWGLLTENLDSLHQRSGIDPLNHSVPNWLKSSITEDDLKQIDIVVTVGLQSDESGFLGWYKKHNPKGQIVAMNLHLPSYIGQEDFFLQGDAQAMLPGLYSACED
jgi:NAD-dependent deacetylase